MHIEGRVEVPNFLDPQGPELGARGCGVEYAFTLHATGMAVVVIRPVLVGFGHV